MVLLVEDTIPIHRVSDVPTVILAFVDAHIGFRYAVGLELALKLDLRFLLAREAILQTASAVAARDLLSVLWVVEHYLCLSQLGSR